MNNFSGNQRGTARGFRNGLCLLIAVVAIASSTFLLTGISWSQSADTKPPPKPETLPYWAFAVDPPSEASDAQEKPVDETARHVPGSDAAFTFAQVQDFFNPPDWHVDGHPAMPEIVAHGSKPEVYACGYCHLPNGQGRPENASLAGLPVEYIVEQVKDFKSGLRKSSEPQHEPTIAMIAVATRANDEEIRAAARYFSGLKPKKWIHVVQTREVPKTRVSGWMLVALEPVRMEPIGQRIIETPENLERTELRDDASGFLAYVPMGSIRKGAALVTTGANGRTVPCAQCHGTELRGQGKVPSIAGRSPSYIVRQLYDMKSGARGGAETQLMKPVVARLGMGDLVSIAAYLASLRP